MPDAIDSQEVSDDTSANSSEQSQDNASVGSTPVDTPASDPTAGTSTEAGSAVADNPPDDGLQPALTGSEEAKTAVNANAIAQAPQYGEKQYKEVQGWATKLSMRNAELAEELKQLKSELQTRTQTAQQQQTEPWDPDDARHQDFLKLVEKADFYDELLRGEDDPNVIKKLQQKQLSILGTEGVDQLQRWQRAVRQQERERRLNPKAFYQKMIREQAAPVVQETLKSTNDSYQRQVQAVNDVQQWMQDKEIATDENKRKAISLMEKGMPFEVVKTIVERDHYRSQVSAAQKASASAGEKERLLQGNAAGAVTRNPNASKRVDVGKYLNDKGIASSRDKIDALFDLDRQGLL